MNRKVDLGAFVVVCVFAVLCVTSAGLVVGQTMSALAEMNTACAPAVTEAGK